MNLRCLFWILPFFLLSISTPSPGWAKHHRHSTATPTATPTTTFTPTPTSTPTPIPWNGKKLYTFDALWGSKGSGLGQLNDPQGIAIGPDGNIYIADSNNNRILVWDPDGRPLKAYGSFGTRADWRNPPQFNHPTGVFIYPNQQIYVSDTLNNRIVVMDPQGMAVTTWGGPGFLPGQFNIPRTLCEDHFGNIWVLDTGNSRIQIFSNLGSFNSTFGSFGNEANSNTTTAVMNLPLGMALNSIDQAIVADTGNSEMEVFNDGGIPLTIQGWYGDSGPYEFKDPSGVVVTYSGLAAIADGSSGRVCFYNSRDGEFEYLGQWRAKDEILNTNFNPKFRSLACDSQNRLYVTDIQNNCVIRLIPLSHRDQTPTALTPTPTPFEANPYGGVGYPLHEPSGF